MATVKTITELFNEMPEAQKNQNFKILSYIKYIASHTNTDITRWDILKAFGSGDGNNLLTDKAKINKIITDKLMNLMEKRGIPEMADVEKIPELTVALENGFKFSLDNRRKELQRSIDREMSHIESYSRDIQERFKKVTETQKLLDNIVNNPEPIIAIKKEIQDVLTKGIWGNPVIRDNHLYLNTPNNIQIF
jgi:uncharacterized sporulation protein YeaH/YhbH (DUF444 family)